MGVEPTRLRVKETSPAPATVCLTAPTESVSSKEVKKVHMFRCIQASAALSARKVRNALV